MCINDKVEQEIWSSRAIKDTQLFLTPAWKNQTLQKLMSFCCGLSISHHENPVKCNSGAQLFMMLLLLQEVDLLKGCRYMSVLTSGKGQDFMSANVYCFFCFGFILPLTLQPQRSRAWRRTDTFWWMSQVIQGEPGPLPWMLNVINTSPPLKERMNISKVFKKPSLYLLSLV